MPWSGRAGDDVTCLLIESVDQHPGHDHADRDDGAHRIAGEICRARSNGREWAAGRAGRGGELSVGSGRNRCPAHVVPCRCNGSRRLSARCLPRSALRPAICGNRAGERPGRSRLDGDLGGDIDHYFPCTAARPAATDSSGGEAPQIDLFGMLGVLLVTELLPLLVGLTVKHRRPQFADRLLAPLELVSKVLNLICWTYPGHAIPHACGHLDCWLRRHADLVGGEPCHRLARRRSG